MISRDDLKAMMDRIEDMARSGDMAEAQRMLEQMQNILENLRTARRQRRNPGAQEMSRALDDLDALTRDQQQLRDDTYRDGQQRQSKSGKQRRRQNGDQQPGMQDQQDGDDAGDDQADGQPSQDGAQGKALRDRQKQLRDKLGELQRRLDRLKRDGKGLGPADDAMKDAEQALGDDDGDEPGQQPGSPNGQQGSGQQGSGQQGSGQKGKGQKGAGRDSAVDAQGRALEALRQGAQNLAKQMQQGQGQGQGDGVGDEDAADGDGDGEAPPGQPRQAEGERDPLGRPTSRDPLYNPRSRYDPMGASPALRAQRVLEELRRRLGDTARPQEELDYLERLLRRY